MSLLDALYIFGSIASIGGALVALVHARAARRSAGAAQEAVQTARRHRNISRSSTILEHVSSALRITSKYGPGAAYSRLEGVNAKEDSIQLQRILSEIVRWFEIEQPSNAALASFLNRIPAHLDALASARRRDELKRAGSELYQDFLHLQRAFQSRHDELELGTQDS